MSSVVALGGNALTRPGERVGGPGSTAVLGLTGIFPIGT